MIKIIDQEVKFKLVCNYCKIRNVLKILEYSLHWSLSKRRIYDKKKSVWNVLAKSRLQGFPWKKKKKNTNICMYYYSPFSSNFHLYFEVLFPMRSRQHWYSLWSVKYSISSLDRPVVVDMYSCHSQKHF